MSIFNKGGLYMRDPHAGVNDLPRITEMKQAGNAWLAFNVGDFTEAAWGEVLAKAAQVQIPVLPWMYCRDVEDLKELGTLAKKYGNHAIFNCEAELRDGVYSPEEIIAASIGLDACISSEPVPYDSVAWYKLRRFHIHAQLFPMMGGPSRDPRWCRAQFYLYGVDRVSFMYGIKAGGMKAAPTDFPVRVGGNSVYTADDADGVYLPWRLKPYTDFYIDFPYTGPYYTESSGRKPARGPTAKALKIAMHRAGFGQFPVPDDHYNQKLGDAVARFQRYVGVAPATGYYGLGAYEALKRLPSAIPGGGMAVNEDAQLLIEADA
jgi:hypothetical protein